MLKLISSLCLSALAIAPTISKDVTTPAPPPPNTIVVSVGENANACERSIMRVDGDYIVGGETADESYKILKQKLDKRFDYMFELKSRLDKTQAQMGKKWDEYYSLHTAYEKELKKIIADWVTNQHFN